MFDGYVRRQERLEDLFIVNCALPAYRGAYGKKAPSYKKLTAHRVKHTKVGEIDQATKDEWREFLKGGTANAQKHGDSAGD